MNTVIQYPFNSIRSIGMLVMAMSLAGSSVVVGKMLVSEIPVFLCAFSSLLVAFLCMIPLMRNRFHEITNLSAREWQYLFLQGLCGIVLFRVFTLYGLNTTGAAQAGIITGTTPAVFALLSFLLLGENLDKRSLCGVILAVSGCILIGMFSEEGDHVRSISGSLLILAAVICEALFTIFRKRIAASVSATTNTAVLIFCSLLLLALPAFGDAVTLEKEISTTAFTAIVYYGLFATAAAYLLWTSAVPKVSGAVAGATTSAMPASSVILAALFLDERLYWQHMTGCLLIIAGIFVSTLKRAAVEQRE